MAACTCRQVPALPANATALLAAVYQDRRGRALHQTAIDYCLETFCLILPNLRCFMQARIEPNPEVEHFLSLNTVAFPVTRPRSYCKAVRILPSKGGVTCCCQASLSAAAYHNYCSGSLIGFGLIICTRLMPNKGETFSGPCLIEAHLWARVIRRPLSFCSFYEAFMVIVESRDPCRTQIGGSDLACSLGPWAPFKLQADGGACVLNPFDEATP